MKEHQKLLWGAFWLLLGAVLLCLGMEGIVDSFWSGMGGALAAVGVMRVIRSIRYRRDEGYRERIDMENRDERNRFISGRAWACAGYFFTLIESVLIIAFKVSGHDALMQLAAVNVCLLVLLYWLCWMVFRRKY